MIQSIYAFTGFSIPLEDHYCADFSTSLTLQWEKQKLQLALYYKYTDDYLEFAGTFNNEGTLNGYSQQYMAGYHTMDISAMKSLFRNRLRLTTGIRNLFNVTQVEAFGSLNIHGSSGKTTNAGYGRSFFLKIGYNFTKI